MSTGPVGRRSRRTAGADGTRRGFASLAACPTRRPIRPGHRPAVAGPFACAGTVPADTGYHAGVSVPLRLPTIQNWACRSCAGCCREHLIEVTAGERDRIAGQGWDPAELPGGREPVVPLGGGHPTKRLLGRWGRKPSRWRLNHAPDGACVFLRDDGLCGIHAKFGEAAKPLACRVYPYAFHPDGKAVTVSLRFSCPTVAANVGPSVEANRPVVREIADAVLAGTVRDTPPPPLTDAGTVDWNDLHRLVDALDADLSDTSVPLPHRLLRCLFWLSLVDRSRFEKVTGKRLTEFLSLVRTAAANDLPADLSEYDPPTRAGRLVFRQTLAVYARKDTVRDLDAGPVARIRLLTAGLKFARGTGLTPVLDPRFGPVPFDLLDGSPGPPPDGADELFTRYFRVKLRGLAFCGAAFDGWPLTAGFFALAAVYPVARTLAAWHAAADGRDAATLADLRLALSAADHHHGYSPATTGRLARRRVRLLHGSGDLAKLVAR